MCELIAFEIKRTRINAVAFASFLWPIIEQVPQMTAALLADDFGSNHSMARVFL